MTRWRRAGLGGGGPVQPAQAAVRRRPGAGRPPSAATWPGVTFSGVRDDRDAPGALLLDAAHAQAGRSAGIPHFFTDVRVDRPDGAEAGARRAGRDRRGRPNVIPGYSDRPEATGGPARRRLAPSGDVDRGRGRVRLPGGPGQGRDHFRRGEHLPGRGRRRPASSHAAVAECGVFGSRTKSGVRWAAPSSCSRG